MRSSGLRKLGCEMSTATATKPELGLVPILEIATLQLIPSPENDRLYRPIDPADLDIADLADSIAERRYLQKNCKRSSKRRLIRRLMSRRLTTSLIAKRKMQQYPYQ